MTDRNSFVNGPGNTSAYLEALDADPRFTAASDALFEILNTHWAAHGMAVASRLSHPALCGIVEPLEAHPAVAALFETLAGGDQPTVNEKTVNRWKQAVGVAVRLRMIDDYGWTKVGDGRVTNSVHFSRAARYVNERYAGGL